MVFMMAVRRWRVAGFRDDGRVDDYELLDFGEGARLERFGGLVTDRPAATAWGPRRTPAAWTAADLRFDRDAGWSGPRGRSLPESWQVKIADLELEARLTEAGQLGLFPEHAAMVGWLEDRVEARTAGPAVLNLFAYTGLTTLAMARADAGVVHVDASRPAVAWARRNAEGNGLADRPIRWLVDDAAGFVAREFRRGRRYEGIVLDPPSYGHGTGRGASRRAWQIERDLPDLLATCRAILAGDGFILLTAHTAGFGPNDLAAILGDAGFGDPDPDRGELALEAPDGRNLVLGAYARWDGGAR